MKRFAALRPIASWLVAVALIVEWPLGLAHASHHLGQNLQFAHDLAASICTGGTPAQPHPAKLMFCPACQAVSAAKALVPAAPAHALPRLAASEPDRAEPALLVVAAPVRCQQPRGPPQA
jgi:hypothetical protein